MALTFNRRPVQVDTPSKKDVKNYFFNHYDWKGICDDKNFLTVDQYTFADCKNVYVDAEGLLRSRPSLKKLSVLQNYVKTWSVGSYTVNLVKTNPTQYDLQFYLNGNLLYDTSSSTLHYSDSNILPILKSGKIFIFANDSFRSFYMLGSTPKYQNAYSNIYIPVTKTITATTVENTESKNIFTNREKYSYLYTKESGINNGVYNKIVSFDLDFKDGEDATSFTSTFPENGEDVVVKKLFTDTNTNRGSNNSTGYLDIIVSNSSTYATFNKSTNTLYYSSTGRNFEEVSILQLATGEYVMGSIKFSQNSMYVTICTNMNVYIVSVLPDATGTYKFEDFTAIKGNSLYNNFNYIPGTTGMWQDSANYTWIDVQFIDWDNFFVSIKWYNQWVDDIGHKCYGVIYRAGTSVVVTQLNGTAGYKKITDGTTVPFIAYYNSNSYNYYSNYYGDALVVISDSCYVINMTSSSVNSFSLNTISYSFYIPDGELLIRAYDSSFVNNNLYLTFYNNSGMFYVSLINKTITAVRCNTYRPENGDIISISNDGSKVSTSGRIFRTSDFENASNPITPLITAPHTISVKNDYIVTKHYVDENNKYKWVLFTHSSVDYVDFIYTKGSYTDNNYFVPEHINELNNLYFSNGNILNISAIPEIAGEDFEWYFPEINKQTFSKTITNMQPISRTEMAIFFEDEVWYSVYDADTKSYSYYKSKLQVGLKEGSDVITSYDGTSVIFPCERGLVSLAYQDFIASTEQSLSYLTDNIYSIFKEYNKQPIKLYRYDFWIICYNKNKKNALVLDVRNASWWPVELPKNIENIYTEKVTEGNLVYERPRILSNGIIYKLDTSDLKYSDDGTPIDWSIKSQKLYLGTTNNYKNIVNMTFNSVLDTHKYPMNFILNVTNYRNDKENNAYLGSIANSGNFDYDPNNSTDRIIEYKVDAICTFVQRMNFTKVNEFEYHIFADIPRAGISSGSAIQVPLSLSSLTIKYKLGSQVR